MENASKALLMAAGILLGILILTLMVTLFISSSNVFKNYDQRKQEEALQQFNVNFTKYLGQKLTIHDVVTICNFADQNDVSVTNKKTKDDIPTELNKKNNKNQNGYDYYYTILISAYNEGRVSGIRIYIHDNQKIVTNKNILKNHYVNSVM